MRILIIGTNKEEIKKLKTILIKNQYTVEMKYFQSKDLIWDKNLLK